MSIDVCFSGKTEGEINVCSKAKCQMQTDKECLVCLVVFPLYCSPACDAATRSGERRILTKRSIDFSCDAHALDRGRHMNVVCMYIVCWRFKHVQTAYKKVSTWEKDPLSWFFIFLYISVYIYIYSLSLFLSEVIQKGQTQVVVGSDTVPDTILEPQLWQLWWWHGAWVKAVSIAWNTDTDTDGHGRCLGSGPSGSQAPTLGSRAGRPLQAP